MDRSGSMRLFLYTDKGSRAQKNWRCITMRKDLNAGSSLRAIMQQHHLALE